MARVAYNASVKQFISDWDTNQFMDIMCKGAEINRIGGQYLKRNFGRQMRQNSGV